MDIDANNLTNLSKEQLVELVIKLKKDIDQINKNVCKKNSDSVMDYSENKTKFVKTRNLDFTRYKRRHIALKLLYLGWNYHGFANQTDNNQTIEYHLFQALIKAKLIESKKTSNYHRCGRTDKGVSSFGQVISIDVRTNLSEGVGVFTPHNYNYSNPVNKKSTEIDYCGFLNKLLPLEIRAIAWAPVEKEFNSRFFCQSRVYKYLFPCGSLNISKMREAGQYLLGTHNFDNFCKKDRNKTYIKTTRTIISVDITPLKCNKQDAIKGYQIYELTIIGKSFLWHQIRLIMTLLFLIGEEKEQPELIKKLLDTSQVPLRPQYCLASPLPLTLFDCEYDADHIREWIYDQESISLLIKQLQSFWTQETIKSTMILAMIKSLAKKLPFNVLSQPCLLNTEPSVKVYKPILERPQCVSIKKHLTKSN